MRAPIEVSVHNDYPLVLAGLKSMLAPYITQVTVFDASAVDATSSDIALLDTFGVVDLNERIQKILAGGATRLAIYTWTFDPAHMRVAEQAGASGYLSKQLDGPALLAALEEIHEGENVISLRPVTDPGDALPSEQDWPGRSEGLSAREAEVLALIAQGLSNDQIAAASYLSINTIKSYIRTTYRKIGVTSRTKALLWALDHGFQANPQAHASRFLIERRDDKL